MDVRSSYDAAATGYAEQLSDELAGKPLDRHLLDRFAESTRGSGLVADIGCGPGHVARYLHTRGVRMCGIDLSPAMVREASRRHPLIEFRAGDMLALDLPDASLAGLVAFYSIVHFDTSQVEAACREFGRVLVPGGLALLAFHMGDQVVHVDNLFGAAVNLDFRFHPVEPVVNALTAAGLHVIERTEREPYEGAEHPSRRAYLLARTAPPSTQPGTSR